MSSGASGLAFLARDSNIVARQGDTVISRTKFLSETEDLASLLPDNQ